MKNIIIDFFETHNLKLTQESLEILKKITNIKIKEFVSKPKNEVRYKWFCDYEGINTSLNFVRKNSIDIPLQRLCFSCGTYLQPCFLSDLISFTRSKNENSLKPIGHLNIRCKKCAAKHNSIAGLEKRKQICLEKYGIEYGFLKPEIIQKRNEILTNRHGPDYYSKFAEKAKQTFFKKHGVDHNTKVPEILKRMVKTRQETIKEMSPEKKKKWAENRLAAYKKEGSPGLFGCNDRARNSKIANEFIHKIIDTLNLAEETYILERPCSRYSIDFFIEGLVFIEFYGDYWHANPEIYKSDDLIGFGSEKFLVENRWIADENRINHIKEELKIPAIIVWEKTYKTNKEKTILDVIKNINFLKDNKNHETKTYIY
jgi:hypothetical protein